MIKNIIISLFLLMPRVFLANIDWNNKLLRAAEDNNLGEVVNALRNGANIEATDCLHRTLLHYACIMGFDKLVKLLIDHNANIKAKDVCDSMPLHYACINGHYKVVMLLIENNADIEAKDKDNWTPLCYASKTNQEEIIKLLNLFLELKNNKNNNIKLTLSKIDQEKALKTALIFIKNQDLNINESKELVSFNNDIENISNYKELIKKYFNIKPILQKYSLNNYEKEVKYKLLLFHGLMEKKLSLNIIKNIIEFVE